MSLDIGFIDNSVILYNSSDRFTMTEELLAAEILEGDISVSFSKRFDDINYYDIQILRYEKETYVPFKGIPREYDRVLSSVTENFLGLNLLEIGSTKYIKVKFEEIPV